MITAADVRRPRGLSVGSPLQRLLRFWGRHLLALNLALCGLVWLLYGDLGFQGYGEEYLDRSRDFWLKDDWPAVPGLENVLLPGVAALFAEILTAVGFTYTATTFVLLAAASYVVFIYWIAAWIRRRARSGRVLAVAVTLALYSSGLIPYMTSWGGSVDGMTYLAMLPVLVWPESLSVYLVTAVLQCLNHYAGLISLIIFAFVWHSLQALDRERPAEGMRLWLVALLPRAILSGIVLFGFMWFWESMYPNVAGVRQTLIFEKWRVPGSVLQQVVSPFPWTLLSTLKLTFIPIAVLMFAPHPRQRLRAATLAIPFVAAVGITFVFLDVTRMALMMVMPAWLATVRVAGGDLWMAPRWRGRVRRVLLATAALSVLIPNYYVNDGYVRLPPSRALQTLISTFFD